MLNKTKLFIVAAVMMLGGLTAVNAQVAPQSVMRTNVPFSFVVNGKVFKAGNYTFGRLNTSGGGDMTQLIMRGPNGETAILATILTIASEAPSKSHLVFENVAGQHVLTEIWGAGDNQGSKLTTSAEDESAIAAAAGGFAGESTSGADTN